jgi:hypothetical protein
VFEGAGTHSSESTLDWSSCRLSTQRQERELVSVSEMCMIRVQNVCALQRDHRAVTKGVPCN